MQNVITPWDREIIQADEQIRQIEREQALKDIVRLMRRHGISLDDLELCLRDERRLEPTDSLNL